MKLKELSQNSHGVCYSPRFSLDGEEVIPTSIKQREHRRLSLGGMEDSLWFDSSSRELQSSDKSTNQRILKASNLMIKDEEDNEYYPGIIAKLMGLQTTTSSKIESFNCQTNRRAAQECKQDKPIKSPRNNPKSPRSINLDTKSACNSRSRPEYIPQKITKQYCDVNMKQKIESAYHVMQQKLQIQCDNKEEEDLQWEILRSKKMVISI
ncbi:hypothetical protein HPP92_005726 [Vanilla planifolia]|uniref:Uncharacterized protein n=1 Tax=Vanilla planifolia TaxID=51239 RepID=A0A835S049_VANPL|nr:hypothetical protein HPP92_005726 [Vanilla planifolia]